MSFIRPTLTELIERARLDVEARMEGADARLRHQVLDVLVRMHAGALSALYGYVDWTSRQILPDTADAETLARHASIWGITRKAAFPGGGNVIFAGTPAVSIPAGTLLVSAGTSQYRTIADTAIAGGGTVSTAVEALETGTRPSLAEGAELTLSSPIGGISSTVTVDAGGLSGGGDEESDESLLSRLLLRIQQPPLGGSANDYRAWALAQDGVTRAWVYPLWLGVGTVGVTFAMDDREDIIPTGPDVTAVQDALDILRPVTANLTVFAPTPIEIDMTITVVPSTSAVRAAIIAELDDAIRRDGEPGGTIHRSRLSEAISIAAGETFHNLTVPAADVVMGAGELPVLGTVTWA